MHTNCDFLFEKLHEECTDIKLLCREIPLNGSYFIAIHFAF